ncbi:STAS 2 domain containing protein [Sulfitobacter noctilucae]|uniref:STAS domain-containing protein n=1 Tax=Sulfitobacter noctilucae TaxID=1342302 RepID=UPI00046848D6|nr:STAS domain-containing protein [Sulfitobacter noctilucae]KIN61108.1 STAS 2 domain containing protein [Sulfitobacter noctilucae]
MTEPVVLEGKLDVSAVGALHAKLVELMGQEIILDFGAVSQIGALCLQSCLAAARSAKAADLPFSIINVPDAVFEQMAVMGFSPETLAEGAV